MSDPDHLQSGQKSLQIDSIKSEPFEPAGLDYCRKHGFNTQYRIEDWSTPSTAYHAENEELLIVGSNVIWTEGRTLKRAYGFESEGQRVRQALFAYFPSPEALFDRVGGHIIPQLGVETQAQSRVHALNQALKSTANVVHVHQSSQGANLERALVIILDEIAHVYHEDGRRDLVSLPFPIKRAFTRETGLVLERLIDPLDFPRSTTAKIHQVPRFFTLRDPLEQLGVVCYPSAETGLHGPDETLVHLDKHTFMTHCPSQQILRIWSLHEGSGESLTKPSLRSTSGAISRRRSSMRTSFIGASTHEDLTSTAEEIPASSSQVDGSIHVDRVPFQDIDPNTLYNSTDNLRKDFSISDPVVVPRVGQSKPKILHSGTLATSLRFYVHFPAEGVLLEMSLRSKRSGKHLVTEVRRESVRSIARICLHHVSYVLLQMSSEKILLRPMCGPELLLPTRDEAIEVLTYNSSSFVSIARHGMQLCRVPALPQGKIGQQILQAFRRFMLEQDYTLFCSLLTACSSMTDADLVQPETVLTTIFACFISGRPGTIQSFPRQADLDYAAMDRMLLAQRMSSSYDLTMLQTYAPQMLISLHYIHEELRLSRLALKESNVLLCSLVQLATWLQWGRYVAYYAREIVTGLDLVLDDASGQLNFQEPASGPTAIIDWLTSIMQGTKKHCPDLDSMLSGFKPAEGTRSATDSASACVCPISSALVEVFTVFVDDSKSNHDVVDTMRRTKMTSEVLENLPKVLVVPLLDAMHQCASSPSAAWDAETLAYIGRPDLTSFMLGDHASQANPIDDKSLISSKTKQTPEQSSSTYRTQSSPYGLIFDQDRRIQEVEKLLNCDKPTTVQWKPIEQFGEAELIRQQNKLAKIVSTRTMAIPVGLASYTYDTYHPLPTQQFPIPQINFDVKIRPMQVTVSEDKTFVTSTLRAWPFFHNGVAAGLSIAKSAREISASWIVYNKPEDLSDSHAGFLLGLGLNGHLRAMATWHAFNYLTSKHTMTSIGLLLGLSASFLGTMDPMVAKLLSVHILALLPPGSNELNLSGETQAAGIVGIGLLYFNTKHRGMSETLLREICAHDRSSEHFRDESYRLSAGIALGMVNVGQGTSIQGDRVSDFESKLMLCVQGLDRESHDLDVKMPGAIIALALLYLRTNNIYVADRLFIPSTKHAQSQFRPDLYLLRALARGLILWNDVSPTQSYIADQVPHNLRAQIDLSQISYHDDRDQMLLNIVVGASLAVGLKYAGTLDVEARDFILAYLDRFIMLVSIDDHGVDHKASRIADRTSVGVLCLAASLIMAGSGDLEVLRRLRRLHYRLDPDTWYGNYMAVDMAVGLLFMSQGRSSVCNSDLAICSFVAALYPILPNSTTDNHSHLQALRHLWVLGAESRCIDTRDTTTNQSCLVPIEVHFKDSAQPILQTTAPSLLPPLSTISSIQIRSSEYWPISLEFAQATHHLKVFRKNQTVYVTRRLDASSGQLLDLKTQPIGHGEKAEADMVHDILARFDNRLKVDEQCVKQALIADDSWHWNTLSIRMTLLSTIRSRKSDVHAQSYEMLFAYWRASTSGFLASKFSNSERRCLDENFVQQLQLELWRRRSDGTDPA